MATYITDIERLNYYEGEYLGAVDFEAEQEYQRDMRRRHNIGQHTWGIVSGLDIAQIPNGFNTPVSGLPEVDVYIQPGMAVDGFGREIVVLSKTQLTTDLFAPFYNPLVGAAPLTVNVWISYAEVMLDPATDACTPANQSDAFSRVQETFAFTITQGNPPTDDAMVVDGVSMTVPVPPTASSPPAPTPQPGAIVLPYDGSVPYQEFATSDSGLYWYVLLGQVSWDPHNQVLIQKPDVWAAANRQYAGSVCAAIYAPAGALLIKDRRLPSPPPAGSGVAAVLEGSLTVDQLLNGLQRALIGGSQGPGDPAGLSPLTIIAGGANEDLIQMRNPANVETWYINEKFDGSTPGLNVGEVTSAGKNVPRIFVQPTKTSGPSTQNVGIGTTTPRNPLAIRAQGAWEELLSFEDTTGTTQWHLNQKPQGVTPGLNFSETQASDGNFRLFLQEGGNVGIGTPVPEQNLSVNAGLNIDQANQNPGGSTLFQSGTSGPIWPALTFGQNSGEGIASDRKSANKFGLDFYTAFNKRMSIDNSGAVTIPGSLTVLGAVTIPGPTVLGAVTTIPGILNVGIVQAVDVFVAGSLVAPSKTACVADRFINRDGIQLERGDVVVLHSTPSSQYYGSDGQIPFVEIQLTDTPLDTRVCGIVDEPALADSRIRDLDRTKIGNVQVGLMVTLGAYSTCKVDADIAPISPGDLLTTSPTRGYAQKVDPNAPARSGAIIGKALGSLTNGKGTIPVFVSHH